MLLLAQIPYKNYQPSGFYHRRVIKMTDTELKIKGFEVLSKFLGDIEAERFISLILREPFDYTKWRQGQWDHLSLEQISRKAMELRRKNI
jgi:hypothetical protein